MAMMIRSAFVFILRCVIIAIAIAAGALWLTKPWEVA